MEHLTPLQPPSVRELITATLTEKPRITLHELERAAALHGHSSIEVEIVLKSFLRDRRIERVPVFQLRDPNADVCEGDTEPGDTRTVSSMVDLAQSSREVAAAAIAKASRHVPHAPKCERDVGGFWRSKLGVLQALPTGQTFHLIHPDRTPALLAKHASVMLCNWRTAKKLVGQFKCRRTVEGVLITRVS